ATGKDLWSCQVGENLEWSPAVQGGRIYLGTSGGGLVCVDTGDPANTGWPMWGGGPGHNGPSPAPATGATAVLSGTTLAH
ncbi:MAG: PQQ-binding-like beta-propeller repeat protein, partial [Candidatus Sericytochromatia bacterium]|nr:PQQ-binding-like beta-propeller repeat protein [Candidatus Tanganyikabacteria bacterium]